MAREYLPKLTIALLALSVALVLASARPPQVAAAPTTVSTAQPSGYTPNWYNSTYNCYDNYWYYYWGYPYYYCDYYSYYYGYPYYYYYYGYPYYYNNYGYGYNYYASPASYTLTVRTDPSNLGTVTGGGSFTQGSSASFSVTQSTVQVSSNTRYVFSHWSGDYSGVGTSGTVTVNGAMTITAVYQLQYYLSTNAQPQSVPTPQGAGWYNSGDTATLQNAGQIIGGDSGSRLMFQGWSVDGQAPQSGSSLNVVMNAPHSVTELYGQQYYLNVQTDQGVSYGSGWYDSGSTAQIYVSTPASTTYGVSMVFNGWQGDVQSGSQSTTVMMNGPKNAIATWRADATVLYLTIAAIVAAALLIVAGLVAFLARGRGSMQAAPRQPPPPRSNTQTEQTAARTEHHRKKPTDTPETSQTGEPAS